MSKVRWGVLGVAGIASGRSCPRCSAALRRSTALASRDPRRATPRPRPGHPGAYGSYEELLADPDIEAVYNPLPNHLHVPWTIRALEAGQARAVREADRAHGRGGASSCSPCATAPACGSRKPSWCARTRSGWRARDSCARAGSATLAVDVGLFSYFNEDPRTSATSRYGGGGLLDIGCYLITIARFLFEREPRRALGLITMKARAFRNRPMTSLLLDFARTATPFFTCSTQLVPPTRPCRPWAPAGGSGWRSPSTRPPTARAASFVDHGRRRASERHLDIDVDTCNQYTIQGDLILEGDSRRHGACRSPLEDAVDNMACIDAIVRSTTTGCLGGRAVTVSIYLGLDSSTQSLSVIVLDIEACGYHRPCRVRGLDVVSTNDFRNTAPSMACCKLSTRRLPGSSPLMWVALRLERHDGQAGC